MKDLTELSFVEIRNLSIVGAILGITCFFVTNNLYDLLVGSTSIVFLAIGVVGLLDYFHILTE